MDSPLSIFECGLKNNNIFNISYFNNLLFTRWKIIIKKGDILTCGRIPIFPVSLGILSVNVEI